MSQSKHLHKRVAVLLALNSLVTIGLLVLLMLRFILSPASENGLPPALDNGAVYARSPEFDQNDRTQPSEYFSRSQPSRKQLRVGSQGRIALVLDDLGYTTRSETVRGFLSLPIPLTVGIIPGLPASRALAAQAHEHGYEVLAHVPMETIIPRDDTGTSFLHAKMSDAEFGDFMSVVGALPYAVGLSNHQGSAATQDSWLMAKLSQWCSQRGWYMLDSITHPGTVLYRRAKESGIQTARRDMFLDHHPVADSIRARLHDAELLAMKRESAVVVIAHPRALTLEVLQQEIGRLREHGIEFVRLSDTFDQSSLMAVGDSQ